MNPGLLMFIGGGLLSAGGSMFGGMQAAKQGKYAADILKWQARYVDAATKIEEAKIERTKRQTISAQRASTAASGIRTDVGAPLDVEIETEIMADIDKNILRMSGGIEKLRYQTQSHLARAQGYGQSSAMYAQGFNSLLSTGLGLAERQGWFAPANKKKLPYIPAK